jgi:hypothetical protein
MLPDFQKRFLLEDSQGSSSLSNWQEQHVDEEECGALVE